MTAQNLVTTRNLTDVAATRSIRAWIMTGRYACYLLAEARPMPQQLGDLQFNATLLRNRAGRAPGEPARDANGRRSHCEPESYGRRTPI
jgi:hypothetical protein